MKTVYKLIEDNGLTLHGDIEHFAALVAEHIYTKYLEPPEAKQSGTILVTAPLPIAYLCENAVGHKYFRWKKPSSTYKPVALYTTPPQRKPEQEPVEYQMRMRPTWEVSSWSDWKKCSRDAAGDYDKTPKLHDWEYETRKLYAQPVTQDIPQIPQKDSSNEKRNNFLNGYCVGQADLLAEQAKQEPAAWMVYTQDGQSVYVTDNPTDIQKGQRALPLYTTPPQRTWVGLTDHEIDYLCDLAYTGDEEFALAVQGMLKEKNT